MELEWIVFGLIAVVTLVSVVIGGLEMRRRRQERRMLEEGTGPIFLAFDLTKPEPRANAGGGPRPKGAERHLAFDMEAGDEDEQATGTGGPLPIGSDRHLAFSLDPADPDEQSATGDGPGTPDSERHRAFTLQPDADEQARIGGKPRPLGGDRPADAGMSEEPSTSGSEPRPGGGDRLYAFSMDIPEPEAPPKPSPFGRVVSGLGSHTGSNGSSNPPEATDAELFESRTIRFHQPLPGTMKLLPGRLEVIDGDDVQSEIRFVDFPGEPVEVTFGRSPGQPLRHVQLTSPTISRKHARMVRKGKDWVIFNLSQTNPIIVNGTALLLPEEQRVLNDSDRIEMGELVFRYHAT